MDFPNMNISTENSKIIQQDFTNIYCNFNCDNICRVCMERNQSNKKMFNIFEINKLGQIYTMINACASVQVIMGDGLPNTICQKCLAKLNIAWQFKILCENSDAKLRNYFGGSQDEYVTAEIDAFKDDCIFKEDGDASFTTDICELNNSTDSSNESRSESKDSASEKCLRKPSKRHQKEQKNHQCDTCGKIFNRREYLTQHIRIHTGEKPYRCHLCEKRFVNSGHLITHMRTHTGERPHSCKLCPKAFSTKQELHKHTMVHNGDRPFVCNMCGKRFGSSSNLYSHLKHHTGEKNFTCEHCGKAFYTKQELKQHLVVHTGEKAFLCEYCHKRFSQIAHLRRHSKLHES